MNYSLYDRELTITLTPEEAIDIERQLGQWRIHDFDEDSPTMRFHKLLSGLLPTLKLNLRGA